MFKVWDVNVCDGWFYWRKDVRERFVDFVYEVGDFIGLICDGFDCVIDDWFDNFDEFKCDVV